MPRFILAGGMAAGGMAAVSRKAAVSRRGWGSALSLHAEMGTRFFRGGQERQLPELSHWDRRRQSR